MERKRKLPARAAARGEHVAKKRSVATPSTERSLTPVPAQTTPSEEPSPAPTPQQPPLPTSIQNGKPLPTVETPQPDDLHVKDYQTIPESGVVAESLARSRKMWMEGLFEKYWTKPSKRKGAVEDAKNPAKDTMVKLGTVTIKIEPHILDATMFAVKDPKPPPASTTPSAHASSYFRPILQYGPPGGELPPLPPPPAPRKEPENATSASKPSTPVVATQWPPQTSAPTSAPAPAQPPVSSTPTTPATPAAAPPAALSATIAAPIALKPDGSRPPTSSAGSMQPAAQPAPAGAAVQPGQPISRTPSVQSAAAGGQPPAQQPGAQPQPPRAATASSQGTPNPQGAPAKPNDPIIATLAEKASEDPKLREIMKRVAGGTANMEELATFQKVIDRITVEYKRKNAPFVSPESVYVDNKNLTYYANEIRAIIEVVLGSHPQQRGSTLKAPNGVNPLIMGAVKAALDDTEAKNVIQRIANKKPLNTDSADLKELLEKVQKEMPRPPPALATNGANGHSAPPTPGHDGSQALRSKGPPKQEMSAIVFEFAAGNGDRYLFPKFSILKYDAGENHVIASFLIVRKGSASDKEGDPALDYWEPVTVRITGKHVEHLRNVVASELDVKRYMDTIKRTMTRAEFVILATRLPREKDDKEDRRMDDHSGKSTPRMDGMLQPLRAQGNAGVLWTARAIKPAISPATTSAVSLMKKATVGDDDRQQAKYHKFINTVAGKEPEMA